jgi:hypothetical protein
LPIATGRERASERGDAARGEPAATPVSARRVSGEAAGGGAAEGEATKGGAARPAFGRRWTEDDDAGLRRLIAAREPPARIAKALKRTQDAVRGRAAELRLTLPSPLRPWRRFATPNGRRDQSAAGSDDQPAHVESPSPERD